MNNDTLLCIFDYIHLADLLNCYLVCKQYCHVANSELKWRSLFSGKFVTLNGIIVSNYQIQYKRHYKLNEFLKRTIKKNINEFINYRMLGIMHMNLHYIPSEIGDLINLTELILTSNKLELIASHAEGVGRTIEKFKIFAFGS